MLPVDDPNTSSTHYAGTLRKPQAKGVTVEYTANGQRVRKHFTTSPAAKRFYTVKSAAGADPKIIRVD